MANLSARCYAQCATAERCAVATVCPYLLPDPDYACGAAYCDDPACNTHSHRPDLVLKRTEC